MKAHRRAFRSALWGAICLGWLLGCAMDSLPSSLGGEEGPQGAPAEDGIYLHCITNVGRTLLLFDAVARRALAEPRLTLAPDPVGPWFADGVGYYLSRVASDGSGHNALLRFDPRSLARAGTALPLAPLSNPSDMLILPGTSTAWIALRGSTFDGFATNGIAVVDLANWRAHYVSLTSLTGDSSLTSLTDLLFNADCDGAPCVYGLVNNWNGRVRQGFLLVLRFDAQGEPSLAAQIPLGRNPFRPWLDAARGNLWVPNNGGYVQLCPPAASTCEGQAGSVWVLDGSRLARLEAEEDPVLRRWDSASDPQFPADPQRIFGVGSDSVWILGYPEGTIFTVPSDPHSLALAQLLPLQATGPVVALPAEATAGEEVLLVGLGGFGPASLGRLDPLTAEVVAHYELNAGGGEVHCSPHVLRSAD